MFTYSNIQSLIAAMMPGASSGFVSTSGSPSELAYYLRMTNSEIAMGAHKFTWMIREYELTLTGAEEYDLSTLIPDLIEIYQIHGTDVPGYEMGYRDLREYNLTVGGVQFTIMGGMLRFQNPPAAGGTLTIPYYSNYLVSDNASVRKLDFEDGDDYWIGPKHLEMMLIEGTLRFYNRKEKEPIFTQDTVMWDGRVVKLNPFQSLYWVAVQADQLVSKPIYDFRFQM